MTPLRTPPRATAVDARNPFAGLQSFGEADQAYFRGRDTESQELFRLVRREALTVVFGRSGLGKTSLLHAGLFPLLREAQYLPISSRLNFVPGDTLESRVKARIGEALLREGVDARPPGPEETLWEYFHQARWWSRTNRLLTPVLVFDQFEEIFTLGRGDSRVVPLLTELADLIENQIPAAVRCRLDRSGEELPFSYDRRKVHVVFSLREDFLAHLEDLRPQIPSIASSRFQLIQMTGSQARQAILEPAEGLVSEEVAEEILRFVAGSGNDAPPEEGSTGIEELEIEPALLSLFCRELNERRLAQGLPALTSGLLHGARGQILTEFYERSLAGLPPAVWAFVEDRLLTASGFRHSEPLEEAVRLPGVTEEDLRLLVDRRVLRLEPRLGHLHVELIHDLLTRVVRESRSLRQSRRHRRRQLLRGAAAALGLTVLLAGTGWAALRQRELKRSAQAHRAQAEEVLNFMLFDLDEELSPIGRLDLIKGVQEAALEYFESLPIGTASPSAARQRAAAFLNIGRIYAKEGRTTAALRSYEQGLALATRTGPEETSPDLLDTEAMLRRGLGMEKLDRGDARSGFAEIWTACQLLRQLASRQPANLPWQDHLSLCLISLSDQFETRGNLDRALELQRESLAIRERLARADPGRQRQRDLADDYIDLADLLQQKGETRRPSELFLEALAISRRLVAEEPDNASWQEGLVYASERLANHLARQGESGKALEVSREKLRITQQLAERDPGNASWQSGLADSYIDIGRRLAAQGQTKQALTAYSRALPLIRRLVSQDPDNTARQVSLSIVYEGFADTYAAQANLQRALEFYRRSLDIDRRLSVLDPGNILWQRNLSVSFYDLGNLLLSQGDVGSAVEHYSASLEIKKQLVARSPADVDLQNELASIHTVLGDVLLAHGDPRKAILHFEESGRIYQRLAGSTPDNLNSSAWAYVSSGRAYEKLGQRDKARQDWRRAVKILEPVIAGSEDANLIDTYAQALLLLGWKEQGRPFVKTLLERGWDDPQFLELVRRNGLGSER